MLGKEHPFDIEFLDHIAIRVRNMKASQKWYSDTLGLKSLKFKEWGDYPIFMVRGDFGVALFPANLEDPKIPGSRNVKIDHFAFRISKYAFRQAITFFNKEKIEYEIQDHYYFESIYLKDPDGHVVELTATTSIKKD